MAVSMDSAARGKVTQVDDGKVIFKPANTTYELYLGTDGRYAGPINTPISAQIRVTARKVYTVPSGGNFIAPIYGPPKTLQGRVLRVDEKSMVIHAGLPVHVDLPAADSAIDLDFGQITQGSLVNVIALPGAKFALATEPGRVAPVA